MHRRVSAQFFPSAHTSAGPCIVLLAVVGCSDASCADGQTEESGRCVPAVAADGGLDSGAPSTGARSSSAGAAGRSGSSGGRTHADAGGFGGSESDASSDDPEPDAASESDAAGHDELGDAAARPDSGPRPDGTPEAASPPCESAECHPEATCDDSSGQSVCACRPGYRGDGIEICDRDECIPLSDEGSSCGSNSICNDPSGEPGDFECACEPGYTHCGANPGQGCETHLTGDSSNCGECGYSCAGSLDCDDATCEQAAGRLVLGHRGACALLDPPDTNGASELRCWGTNYYNRLRDQSLGTGASNFSALGAAVSDVARVRDVATGTAHTCVLEGSADRVHCWGDNSTHQLGTSGPTNVSDLVTLDRPGARALAAGIMHSCLLVNNGTVECWGANSFGQLGRAQSQDLTHLPETISDITDVVQLEASVTLTCARTGTGSVGCWGGKVQGDVLPRFLNLNGTPLSDAKDLAVGARTQSLLDPGFVCALRENGRVVCAGNNVSGQLGNTKLTSTESPDFVEVSGLPAAVDVAAGAAHACAVTDNGQVHCWGDNAEGHLNVEPGASAEGVVRAPSRVVGLEDAIDVEAGESFTCARRRSGQVVCWGNNTVGQLGTGSSSARNGVMDVIGLP